MKYLALLLMLLVGCDNVHHVNKKEVVTKKVMKRHKAGGGDELFYWYMWSIANGTDVTYYSYASSTPVTNYNTVPWSASTTNPEPNVQAEEVSQQTEQVDMNETVDAEGNTQAAEDAETGANGSWETNDNTDAGNDAGDAGSDGGGDAGGDGGGDGGGGGD